MRLALLAAVLAPVLTGVACKAAGSGLTAVSGGGASGPAASHSPAELEYFWRGVSVPFDPFDRPLELTLAFDSYGTGNNAVALTHYSFPSPFADGETVAYHELIDTYELFFYADGRLVLDTVYDYFINGIFVSERVFKDLRMSGDRRTLEGTEAIEVFENGWLTVSYTGWLTLERLD
jgi:hypothetical protein